MNALKCGKLTSETKQMTKNPSYYQKSVCYRNFVFIRCFSVTPITFVELFSFDANTMVNSTKSKSYSNDNENKNLNQIRPNRIERE